MSERCEKILVFAHETLYWNGTCSKSRDRRPTVAGRFDSSRYLKYVVLGSFLFTFETLGSILQPKINFHWSIAYPPPSKICQKFDEWIEWIPQNNHILLVCQGFFSGATRPFCEATLHTSSAGTFSPPNSCGLNICLLTLNLPLGFGLLFV